MCRANITHNKKSKRMQPLHSNRVFSNIYLDHCGELIDNKTNLTVTGQVPMAKQPFIQQTPTRVTGEEEPMSLKDKTFWGFIKAIVFTFF